MSGRHLPVSAPKRVPRWAVAVVAAVVVASVGSAFVVFGPLRVTGGTRAEAADTCAHRVTLNVLASPAIARPIQDVATNWLASSGAPLPRGCLLVSVTGRDDATAESALASGAADATTVWVPNSSIWAQRLSADLAQAGTAATMTIGPSVANSPIVFVAPPGRGGATISAATLARAAANGTPAISLPNPLTTAEGVLTLGSLRSQSPGPSADTTRSLIGLMVVLGTNVIDSPQAGFAQAATAGARPFAASEQAVLAANAAAGHQIASAVYPPGGVESLDYPAVRFARPGEDPMLASTASLFARVLGGVTAEQVFATHGFRNPQGEPIPGATGTGAAPVHALPVPTASETADILRMWSAATEESHTLAVIDVSGSMAEPADRSRTKIQVAATAAAGAVGYFPDSSAFGLWAFSSDQANGLPWAELAPLRPLGSPTQRQRLVAAAGQLPALVGGNTALYDTALAAFEQVRNTYDPGKVNSVVLLTDGKNEYPQGLSLTQLQTKLRSLADPARPVPIITIGIGDQADIATLRQISAVTGGKTYVVHDPAEIRSVFLDAMLQRECRPNCPTGR
jgi:Ca-activated chloride channel family protein